jgi:hypothetical protein
LAPWLSLGSGGAFGARRVVAPDTASVPGAAGATTSAFGAEASPAFELVSAGVADMAPVVVGDGAATGAATGTIAIEVTLREGPPQAT